MRVSPQPCRSHKRLSLPLLSTTSGGFEHAPQEGVLRRPRRGLSLELVPGISRGSPVPSPGFSTEDLMPCCPAATSPGPGLPKPPYPKHVPDTSWAHTRQFRGNSSRFLIRCLLYVLFYVSLVLFREREREHHRRRAREREIKLASVLCPWRGGEGGAGRAVHVLGRSQKLVKTQGVCNGWGRAGPKNLGSARGAQSPNSYKIKGVCKGRGAPVANTCERKNFRFERMSVATTYKTQGFCRGRGRAGSNNL